MLVDWLEALHHWNVAVFLRRSLFVYPLVNAAHILGIALLVGAIVPVDLRVLGLAAAPPLGQTARALARFAAFGLALAAPTGFLLFSVQPLEYAANSAFLAKLTLVALGTANALALRASRAWRVAEIDGEISQGLKAGAAFSIVVWIAAVFAGRAIAFLE
jgi:hypothetical protein